MLFVACAFESISDAQLESSGFSGTCRSYKQFTVLVVLGSGGGNKDYIRLDSSYKIG